MPYTSPFMYFGNRRDKITLLLEKIAKQKPFTTFYDPFCGSGSITLAAMQINAAQRYVMSDSYSPIIYAWQWLYYNPDKLVKFYQKFVSEFQWKHTLSMQTAYYQKIKNEFNNLAIEDERTGLYFPFLINFAQGYELILENNQFASALGQPKVEDTSIDIFEQRVKDIHNLLHKYQISIYAQHFEEALKLANNDDLVCMDMPYPDLPDSPQIYHRPETKITFHNKALEMLRTLKEHSISVVAFYGAGKLNERYFFAEDKLGLQHYVRLDGEEDVKFGFYLEHVYLSNDLQLTPAILPSNMEFYKWLKILNYEECIQYLKQDIDNPLQRWIKPFHRLFEEQ
ncbi:MAG: DNA adenine methylase, partial [Acinetobacter sp.]|nr:DNA adenine methylase [Acinetobacter sp.]